MDGDLKARWITALRSGEYRQAHGTWAAGEKHGCAIQVLLWVSGRQGWADCVTALGLADMDVRQIVMMNDHGISFQEIAMWIEAHVGVRSPARELFAKLEAMPSLEWPKAELLVEFKKENFYAVV